MYAAHWRFVLYKLKFYLASDTNNHNVELTIKNSRCRVSQPTSILRGDIIIFVVYAIQTSCSRLLWKPGWKDRHKSLYRARYCYSKSSVCPSVRLSVCLSIRDVDVRLGSSLLEHPTSAIYRGIPQNSGGIGVGSLFSAENQQYLWNGAR